MSGSLPMPPGGLLSPSAWSAQPPPLPNIQGLLPQGMPPTGISMGSEQMLGVLQRQKSPPDPTDTDDQLPPALRPFAAGLRSTARPAGAAWQQEIVYEKLGKTDDEIAAIARVYFKAAESYDQALSRDRVTASQYYAGRPLGDETQGRSQIVLTVVRDTIRSTLPSLLRVFTGVEHPITFEPLSNEMQGDDQLATTLSRQATEYAKWALFTANSGWQILHDCLLDALTRRAGWCRWHWGKKQQVRTEVAEGLLLPQLQMILSDPGMMAQRITRRPMTPGELQAVQKVPEAAMYLKSGGAPEYWGVTITRTAQQGWPVVEAVPAESVWVTADAATIESARAIFHVRDVPVSDLLEAGLPEAKVLRAAGSGFQARQRREAIARDTSQGYNIQTGPVGDDSMQLCRYIEGWVRIDADNDNRAELLHLHMLGNQADLIQWERTDETPLACFTCYREPSRLIGSSQADMVQDLQRVESRVMRAVLDSLGQSMFPRTVVTLGQVNLADVRQTAIGSIIRTAQQGAVQELVRPFTGKEALPIMEVLESIRESRTGITKASQGLTVDELQSTTPNAVSAQVSAAQDRLDMLARTLAETGLAPLYSGLLKMMARQQDRPNVIRLRGSWIAIDPRALSTMWSCAINVGGRGMPMERLAMLAQIAGKQEQIIAQGGMDNPLCGPAEYRHTLSRMLECANISDVSSFFKALPPGWQPPPTPQKPDTDQILAEINQQKTASDTEASRAKAATDRAQLVTDDERERDKAALSGWVTAYVAAAQHGSPLPSIDEFQQAMKSKVPPIQLLGTAPVPPATSPQQPATAAPQQQPKPAGPPQMGMPQPGRPMMPPQPPMSPPRGSISPATQIAQQQALQGRGAPSAYGQIANRALGSALFGPGGPQIPAPGGAPGP